MKLFWGESHQNSGFSIDIVIHDHVDFNTWILPPHESSVFPIYIYILLKSISNSRCPIPHSTVPNLFAFGQHSCNLHSLSCKHCSEIRVVLFLLRLTEFILSIVIYHVDMANFNTLQFINFIIFNFPACASS